MRPDTGAAVYMMEVLPVELDRAHLAVPRISEIGLSLRVRRSSYNGETVKAIVDAVARTPVVLGLMVPRVRIPPHPLIVYNQRLTRDLRVTQRNSTTDFRMPSRKVNSQTLRIWLRLRSTNSIRTGYYDKPSSRLVT